MMGAQRKDSLMNDSFALPNFLLFLCIWFLSLALFYYIIKVAVSNGVRQANSGLIESIREIEKTVFEIKMGINRKESV